MQPLFCQIRLLFSTATVPWRRPRPTYSSLFIELFGMGDTLGAGVTSALKIKIMLKHENSSKINSMKGDKLNN